MNKLEPFITPVLDAFFQHERSDEGALYQALCNASNDDDAIIFYYFVPIILRCYLLRDTPIQFNDVFECRTATTSYGPYSLPKDPRFQLLSIEIPPRIHNRSNTLEIALRSAEMRAINKLMMTQEDAKNVVLLPTVFVNPTKSFLQDCVPVSTAT